MISKTFLNDLSYKIIGCAIEVHRHLGPGLLESVYLECIKKRVISERNEFQKPVISADKLQRTPDRCGLQIGYIN